MSTLQEFSDHQASGEATALAQLTAWLERIPLGILVILGWALVLAVTVLTRNPSAWPVFLVCTVFTAWWLLPATYALLAKEK